MIPGVAASQPLALSAADANAGSSSLAVVGVGAVEASGAKAAFGAVAVEGLGALSFTSAHRYWRLYLPTNNGGSFTTAGEIELREEIGGPSVATGGTVFASSGSGTTAPALAFDGIKLESPSGPNSYWSTDNDQHAPCFIGYDFGAGNDKRIAEVSYYASRAVERQPSNIVVQSSDDNAAWKTEWVSGIETGWTLGEEREYARAPLPPVYVSDARYIATGTTVTDEFDISGVEFGPDRADRLVIVAFAAGRGSGLNATFLINAVTIGGVAATRAAQALSTSTAFATEIWYARPSGETGAVVITADLERMGRLAMSVFNAVVSGSDATPHDAAGKLTTDTSDTDLDIPANGFAIAAAHNRASGNPIPAIGGIAETFPILGSATLLSANFGLETSASAKTLTLTKSSNALAAASWEF